MCINMWKIESTLGHIVHEKRIYLHEKIQIQTPMYFVYRDEHCVPAIPNRFTCKATSWCCNGSYHPKTKQIWNQEKKISNLTYIWRFVHMGNAILRIFTQIQQKQNFQIIPLLENWNIEQQTILHWFVFK